MKMYAFLRLYMSITSCVSHQEPNFSQHFHLLKGSNQWINFGFKELPLGSRNLCIIHELQMIFPFLKHCSYKTPGPEVRKSPPLCRSIKYCLLSTDCREVQGDDKKPLEKGEECYQELSSNVINKTHPFKLDALGRVKFWRLNKRGVFDSCSMKGLWATLKNLDFLLQQQGVIKCTQSHV